MRPEASDDKNSGRSAWFWMALCCVPMIAIIILVALGYWAGR